jgi:hypothetical protein
VSGSIGQASSLGIEANGGPRATAGTSQSAQVLGLANSSQFFSTPDDPMRITSYYYLAYPDCSPTDPLVAESEVYVEISTDDGTIESFDYTYAFNVCTIGFLRRHLETHPFYNRPALIVVERFDDTLIAHALEALLPDIDAFGVRK